MHALYFFFALYDFIKNKRSNKLAEIKKQRTVGQRPDSALEIPLEDSTPSQGDGVVTTTTATTPGQSLQIPMKS